MEWPIYIVMDLGRRRTPDASLTSLTSTGAIPAAAGDRRRPQATAQAGWGRLETKGRLGPGRHLGCVGLDGFCLLLYLVPVAAV